MKKKFIIITFISVLILILLIIYLLYSLNYIQHKMYSNEEFNIKTYTRNTYKDNVSIDDQKDILNNVREYIATKPKYKSKYYASGYPDDEYGVCTDVVAFGLKGAGYDLMELVNNDIINNKNNYNIDKIDKNIDFRRVRNLIIFFENNANSLTTNIYDIENWQGGDIVIFQNHIGIISNNRNKNGVTFVIHHANPFQKYYEEDILESRNDIVGHYRIS